MTDTTNNALNYPLLARPHVQIHGTVDEAMYERFQQQLLFAPVDGPLVCAITTLGGDPEIARAMGDDIRLLRDYQGRETLFLGKAAVFSAGATFMAAFPATHRFLTRGTRLMFHERQMTSMIKLKGPLRTLGFVLHAKLNEIAESIRMEEEGFRDLVAGSSVTFEEIREKAPNNWYIDAEEARDRGLVLDVI